MTLRIGRTIFAVLLTVAVAALPASLGFAAGAATATTTASAAVKAMPDCDHVHHGAPGQTQKTIDHATCLAACAATCIGFVATDVTGIAYSALETASLKPVRARIDVSSLMGTPPFRPPRA